MPRFFIAVPLPDEVRDRLIAVQPPLLPGMRLLGCEEMHLTLHFLGKIAPQHDELVREALTSVKLNAFPINISGIGRFPPDGETKVLWAGIENDSQLLALHKSIGNALTEAIGFHPEERPYSPHITLARLNSPAPPGIVEDYVERHKGFMVPSVLLDRFVFYSSVFADGIPRYQEEAVFPFGPASALPKVLTSSGRGEFIAYLGPAAIHDGIIKSIRHQDGNLEVTIRGADRTVISFTFQNVIDVQENRAEGMILYALAEYRHREGQRLFVFANWESDDDAMLAVVAEEVTFQISLEGS